MHPLKFCRTEQNGLSLFIRLTPKAGEDNVSNTAEYNGTTYLNIQIRAIPEDGKANKALIKFLSKSMNLPASNIEISRGQTSRFKQVKLYGDPADLKQKLMEFCS